MALSIERLTCPGDEALVAPLFHDHLRWTASRLTAEYDVRFEDLDAVLDDHHAAFRAEMPALLEARGRLLLARSHGEPVGVVALKPVDRVTAEIKRMFVHPAARGLGVGRALLVSLLSAARAEGFRVAQLETLPFMREARALYHSLGFRECIAFDGSEAERAGLQLLTLYMRLPLHGR